MKNIALSKKLRRFARKPRACFWNAWRICERLQGENKSAVYVEGYALSDGLKIFAYGWVELDGEIIDVTLPEIALEYFSALRFSDLDAAQQIPHTETSNRYFVPIVCRYGLGGEKCRKWMNAFKTACKLAEERDLSFENDDWRERFYESFYPA